MICKVVGNGGTVSSEATSKAIRYAVDNGAKVINMSLAGDFNALESTQVSYAHSKNVTICAGTGNENIGTIGYPSALSTVISVGSTDPDDRRSHPFGNLLPGSNYGPQIDVVAPGNYIYYLHSSSDKEYSSVSGGTSNSTAYVTGLVSLLLSQDPSRRPDQIEAILRGSADDQVGESNEDAPGWDQFYGSGRVNAQMALSYVLGVLIISRKKTSGTMFELVLGGLAEYRVENSQVSGTSLITIDGRQVRNRLR